MDEYCVFMLFKIWNSFEKSAFVTVGHFVDVNNMHCNDISFSIVTYPSEAHLNTAKQNDCSNKLTVNMVPKVLMLLCNK